MPSIRALFAATRAVCFDVDSTVIQDEGIDVLAAYAGVGAEVAAMTADAMGGSLPFEVALERRLALIRPSRELVARCLAAHPPRLTPGVATLVATLHARGVAVYLISGGFRAMIDPVAEQLTIAKERVIANTILFHDDGSYAGFDANEPTSRSGGKATAIARLQAERALSPLIMIGDGVTDLEARPPADGFIGFGGVVVRERVRAGADWFVTDFDELTAALTAPADP